MQKWLLFSALFFALPARAQTPAVGQKIEYRRDLPKSVARLMPRGAKSLFYGTSPTSKGMPNLAFHLFTLQPQQLLRGERINAPVILDVLTNSAAKRRINRVELHYKSYWPPSKWALKFYWLDPTTKKIPLIVLDSFEKGDYGPIGLQHFVVFPKGWGGESVVESVGFGSWNASDTLGQTNTLVVDEKGFVGIDSKLSPRSDPLTPEQIERDYTFSLRWSESRFKLTRPLSETLRYYYSPSE